MAFSQSGPLLGVEGGLTSPRFRLHLLWFLSVHSGARVTFTQIQTPRLLVRRFQETDLTPFVEYRNDPEVARYQGWDTIPEARAAAMIQEQLVIEPGVPGQWFQFAIEL